MKPKILFVYECTYELRDGLWAALELLKDDFEIGKQNIIDIKSKPSRNPLGVNPDLMLGWGSFRSNVDEFMQLFNFKKALCIGGVTLPHGDIDRYDILFYETEWYRPQIEHHKNIKHAFGVNTDIFKPMITKKIWDYMTCGAFSLWKRQHLLANKVGNKIAVGDIQENNPQESLNIIAKLLANHIMVGNQVDEYTLAKIYNASDTCYIPAEVIGGGERAILEARACGIDVEVEEDNPKLQELLTSPVWDHKYYARQLKEGILSVL